MLLKSLKLKNFRQYKGEQVINFSTDPEKNLTIITGENSQGKTTFVHAFRWLLYDDSDFKKKPGTGKTMIINAEVAAEMLKGDEKSVLVELVVDYSGQEYVISRELEYKSYETGSASPKTSSLLKVKFKNESGILQRVDSEASKVQTMFPEGLSNYLFFDGEKDITSGKEVEKAVSSIMGLDVLSSMIQHVRKAYDSYSKKIKGDPDAQQKINDLNKRKDELQHEGEQLVLAIDRLKAEVESYEGRLVDLKEKQRQNADSINMAKERDGLESDLRQLQEKLDRNLPILIGKQSRDILPTAAYPLMKRAMAVLESESIQDKGIPNMNADSLRYILEHGECICGRKISEDPDAIKHIEKLFDYLPPKSIGTMISEVQSFINNATAKVEASSKELPTDYKNYYLDVVEQIKSHRNRHEELSNKLKDVPSTGDIQKDITMYEGKCREVNDVINSKTARQVNIKQTISEIERDIRQLSSQDEGNLRIYQSMLYLEKVGQRASRMYNLKTEDNIEEFKEIIQKEFDSMFRVRGERTVRVDKNYNVTLPLVRYSNLDTSEGTDVVKNFAFISSLIKMANNHSVNNEDDIQAEKMPLVMDAPFSKLDRTHISNISQQLPTLAHQSVITMLELQWKNASKTIDDHVGKRYVLVAHSQTYTEIKEVE